LSSLRKQGSRGVGQDPCDPDYPSLKACQLSNGVAMKKILLVILLGLATASYGQFYEPEHLWHRNGESGDYGFGMRITGVGDVNGDSCDDFIVSVAAVSYPQNHMYLFYGGIPPDTIPDLVFRNPYSDGRFDSEVCSIGDVNGDGYQDIATGACYTATCKVFIYYGGNALDTIPDVELAEPGTFFSSNICGAGDVNGDGYDDIAVQAESYMNYQGKVWIYFGGNPMDTIPDWEKAGTHSYAGYGHFMAGGDLNGDGYSDFVIFENFFSYSNYQVFFGGVQLDTIPNLLIEGDNYPPDTLGGEVSIININADCYGDLLIAAGLLGPQVKVFFGGNPMNTEIDAVLGGLSGMEGDIHIARAGDINADGYNDVIVGQAQEDNYGGRVSVFLGGAWVNPLPAIRWMGIGQPWEGCGESVCDPGDINGDGVDDMMFSCYGHWNPSGRVDIWTGDIAFVAGVEDMEIATVPTEFQLLDPYPNPFNSSLTIPFEIFNDLRGDISLIIYNVLGQMVVDLRGEVQKAMAQNGSGLFQVVWDGKDTFGHNVSSGVYIIILQWGVHRQLRKAVMLR